MRLSEEDRRQIVDETVALLQAEIRGLQEQLSRMDQLVFMLDVDASEMESRLLRQMNQEWS
jgi:FtsZ-binding cell division protein ZapB